MIQNTIEDYCRWRGQRDAGQRPGKKGDSHPGEKTSGLDPFGSITPEILHKVSQTLVGQETAYQHNLSQKRFSSLWAHSYRVACIARSIAKQEGWEEDPAMLAGLFHDMGKFAEGSYHPDNILEEKTAVRFVESILSGTLYERCVPPVKRAILTMHMEGEAASDIGRALYDADCLDKLGHMGVAQFFTKKALRRRFLDDDMMIQTSIELTYAHHAPETLKTATGRSFAREQGLRTRRFYEELLAEWMQLGLGAFRILEEDIGGVLCVFVVPCACSCGGRLEIESDIRDSLKCRSAFVKYVCVECGNEKAFSFCLPNMRGLPRRREGAGKSP